MAAKKTTKRRALRATATKKRRRNPRYFVVGIDDKGREHDLAVRVAANKTQTLQWAKRTYPGYKKYVVSLSDKADYIGPTGMTKIRRPKRARNKTIISKPKRVIVLNPGKVVRRKVRNSYVNLVIRGTAEKTPQGWRVGKKTIPQGKGTVSVSSGYYLDKATGTIFAKRTRNVAEGFYDASGVFHPIRSSADYDGGIAGEGGGKPRRTRSKKKRAAARKASATARHRASTKARKATTARLASRSLFRSVPLKKKRNPPVRDLREKFTGTASRKTATMNASEGTPTSLAKLGKLILIKAERGTIKPASGTTWLCADAKGKLHLTTTAARLVDGPAQNFGEVSQIEYEASKPHLGHKRPTIFFHKMGEDGGKRPVLIADGKGGLKLRGGSYRIEREGIVD